MPVHALTLDTEDTNVKVRINRRILFIVVIDLSLMV
jgi:hypothetical protein